MFSTSTLILELDPTPRADLFVERDASTIRAASRLLGHLGHVPRVHDDDVGAVVSRAGVGAFVRGKISR